MVVRDEGPPLPLFTRILPINVDDIGTFAFSKPNNFLEPWSLQPSASPSAFNLLEATDALRTTLHPVAFPTETVYGLGANALSSHAVRGIYAAKQRPSDNPLIVHIASLDQLRALLDPADNGSDPIPQIYLPLIKRFWPGPLSILLPNPKRSTLAPEVTASQPTFAARMPSSKLALALIKLSGLPLAAPSANASTKPSPTTAQHVAHDLEGRIEIILDGGPCAIGVESTVVDGLSSPPCILRPGGVGIEQIRACPSWEDVVVGYQDRKLEDEEAARAPGMKYKHYSPAAKVVLADAGVGWEVVQCSIGEAVRKGQRSFGVMRTKRWEAVEGSEVSNGIHEINGVKLEFPIEGLGGELPYDVRHIKARSGEQEYDVWDLSIGPSVKDVARDLFSALRELDLRGVSTVFVEGIEDEGETAAAVMNRLRKAATESLSASM
ncbi:MAG: hypothetical protein LQ340_000179 [Diploschistes diacapsis]|nr:MAG: hypothetical protein LQ340_000179 [Diploschistes diacapsis]